MTPSCPFCDLEAGRVLIRLQHVIAIWDAYPVADGHALIVPIRHVSNWFDASADERAALFGAIEPVCAAIRERWGADGFNVGFNLGRAAGQTVPHLHLHVIPRRSGDVSDPRGGIRHVIPGKGNYLAGEAASHSEQLHVAEAIPLRIYDAQIHIAVPGLTATPSAPLLTTGGDVPLLKPLEQDLAHARQVDVAVAFVLSRNHSQVAELMK